MNELENPNKYYFNSNKTVSELHMSLFQGTEKFFLNILTAEKNLA